MRNYSKKNYPYFKTKTQNYELVLINHASTDGSLEVMKLSRKSKRKIIDVKNNETFGPVKYATGH